MSQPQSRGTAAVSGTIRTRPEDFFVDETLAFTPAGSGEHLLVRVEKTGANTAWVADRLAEYCKVAKGAVGYAGRKDRHAVTRQWFSVWLPGSESPPMGSFEVDGVRVIESVRHNRKLRRGALASNDFRITVRDLNDPDQLLQPRLENIRVKGFPNFFGPQRFGRDGANLEMARRWFSGRAKLSRNRRSLALSAARAEIFNAVLARRLEDGSWVRAIDGDALMLDGRGSFFIAGQIDAVLDERLLAAEVHPTGPLWGEGSPPVKAAAAQLEAEVAGQYGELAAGLAQRGLRQERRSLRVMARDLQWELTERLVLKCRLPAGVFATSLLSAAMNVRDATRAG